MKKEFSWVGIVLVVLVAIMVSVSGCAPAAKPKKAKPIVLGVPIATAFAEGVTTEQGIKLAVEEINAKGGVKVGKEKRPFKVEVMDARSLEPGVPVSEALMVVERLIKGKKADFIIGGPIRTEAYNAAMDLFSKYKKVSIAATGVYSPSTTAKVKENYEKYKYTFRNTGDVRVELGLEFPALGKWLDKEHGFNSAYIIVQDVRHARKSGKIAEKLFTKWGWEVLGEGVYPTGASDFSPDLRKAKKLGADLLWVWMDMPQVSILARQWHSLKVPALPVGYARPVQDPGFWKDTEGGCAYWIPTVLNAGNAPSKATDRTMEFYDAYTERWGEEPSGYSASSAYMAPYILADAIERAGTLDSDAVIKALEKTDIKEGVYGRVRFDPESHNIIRKLDPKKGALGCWFQWQEGKRVAVWPPKVAIGKIKMPPWSE